MTLEERDTVTADYIADFEAQRETATTSVENVNIKAFHDVKSNVAQMEANVSLSSGA
jgi:hypothetical protein